jgi:2-polyprenyl-3-methyl-5-hydroxy-6-metoxy-1,4-benzoquinol methylase
MLCKERKLCILCDLIVDNILPFDLETPVFAGATTTNIKDDLTSKFNIQYCNKCNSAQTKYLIPLEYLYQISHNQLVGDIWEQHHYDYANFIIKHNTEFNILEVGAGNMKLAKNIIDICQGILNYTSLDINLPKERDPRFNYIASSFENIENLHKFDTIIISHVFEHFYEPKNIVKMFSDNFIKDVFISLPDFESYVKNGIYNVLNIEHTFYIDKQLMQNLFGTFGFELINCESFRTHSIFYHFKQKEKIINVQHNTITRKDFDNYINNIKWNAERFNFFLKDEPNSYIFPCHTYIQTLVIFGLNLSKIKGVIDNNHEKIGKRLYGTNLICYNFTEIISDNNVFLLLVGGLYNIEIEKELKNINFSNYICQLFQIRRIAMCLNGQPRFYQKGYEHMKNILYKNYFIDTFCHFWWDEENVGQSYTVAPWAKIKQSILVDIDCYSYIKDHYLPKKIKAEKSTLFVTEGIYTKSNSPSAPNNLFSKCFSQKESILMKSDYEKENNFIYDIVIINRYDIVFPNEFGILTNEVNIGLDLNTIDMNNIYNPRDNIHYYVNNVVADHIIFCNSINSNLVGELYDYLDEYYQSGIVMNAEDMFTKHFKVKNLFDIFIKYTVPNICFFRS